MFLDVKSDVAVEAVLQEAAIRGAFAVGVGTAAGIK